jgi:NADH:ubiquinone oxidoreductase subunit C
MSDETDRKEQKPVNDIKSRIDRMDLKLPKPRLITIIANDNADGTFELIYGFHYNNQYTDVRFTVKGDDELESLSSYYAGAVNMEREVIDMMGLHFKGVEGGLLLDPAKGIVTPLRKPLKPTAPLPAAGPEAVPTEPAQKSDIPEVKQ